MLEKADIFVPFAKSEKLADGTVMVYGKVTDATVDLDGQIADPVWSKAALAEWFERAANIREMHQPSAVGKGIELSVEGDATYLKAKIVDPVAARKVEEGVYTGYSWGAKRPIVVPDPTKKAPGGIIKGGLIVEVSVVDQPANPAATFTLAKMSFEEMHAIDPDLAKREFSTEERERMSDAGTAMPDGSYPIANRSDLRNAIQAFGRAKNPEQTKKHIMRRARALGLEDMIPENWKSKTKAAETDSTSEEAQVSKVEQIMQLVRELIAEEAMETHGDDETQCLQLLVSALCTLSYFKDIEHEEAESMVMGAMKMAEASTLYKGGMTVPRATARYAEKMHGALTKMMGDKMCKAYMLPLGGDADAPGSPVGGRAGGPGESMSPISESGRAGGPGETMSPLSPSDYGDDSGGALGPSGDTGGGGGSAGGDMGGGDTGGDMGGGEGGDMGGGDTGGGGEGGSDEGSAEAAAMPDRSKGGYVTRAEFNALKAAMAELSKGAAPSKAYLGPALTKSAPAQSTVHPLRAAMLDLARTGGPEDRKQANEWLERNP